MGLSMADMNELTIGTVMDMLIEASNDSTEYDTLAGQKEFDSF